MRGDFDEDEYEYDAPTLGERLSRAIDDVIGGHDLREMWQPIETAPKDGSIIILGNPESDDRAAVVTTGMWDEADEDGPDNMGHDAGWVDVTFDVYRWGRSFGNPTHRFEARQPTHWMPLPAPPVAARLAQEGT